MAFYPTLKPTVRRYTLGIFPVTIETGFGGGNTRFLHSSTSSSYKLELGYENLSESEAATIRSHYRGQDGSHQSFQLPSDIWAGYTNLNDVVAFDTQWIYDAAPEETQKSAGFIDLSVTLRSVL